MKIVELEIRNVRGIRHIVLTPGGKNLVVWGPNGSGKSAVVDAVDFLLTGRISRLLGQGTNAISLAKHGPHVDADPKEATVRAVIQFGEAKDYFELQRCIDKPAEISCKESDRRILEQITSIARRGQHVLTRRELLRFITAESGTRAQQIQELLNLSEIEDVRKSLVRVQNDLAKSSSEAKRRLNACSAGVASIVRKKAFDANEVLQVVNQHRSLMGGLALGTLLSTELKSGCSLPVAVTGVRQVNATLLEADISTLLNSVSESQRSLISTIDKNLRADIGTVQADPSLLRSLLRRQLIETGIQLIDSNGSCPLCDVEWEEGKLLEHLSQKLLSAQRGKQHQDSISKNAEEILTLVNVTTPSLQRVISACEIVGLENEAIVLRSWDNRLHGLTNVLHTPVEKYLDPDLPQEDIARLLAPDRLEDLMNTVLGAIKARFPVATPEQTAWDFLTSLEVSLKTMESVATELERILLSHERASVLLASFEGARDDIMEKTYDSIRQRFVDLYRDLHGSDEAAFEAILKADGPSLNMEVDFYGRGTHPPHALHSEGHQDSMGLCLYLALSEKLTDAVINLTILDDVVMSVDSEHRRELCRVLAKHFPNRQFLITTHDKTWATQLRTDGVVTSKAGTVEFYNWTVESGPQVNFETDIWERIEKDLQRSEVAAAAARLRRGSEEFFGRICDALNAKVTYRLSGRWELGDLLPAGTSRYSELLKKAKDSANSWGLRDEVSRYGELGSTTGQIFKRTGLEEWAVNASVHYNNWASLSVGDFRPVIEAFQDLFAVFICQTCGGDLALVSREKLEVAVKCRCGSVSWNLALSAYDA